MIASRLPLWCPSTVTVSPLHYHQKHPSHFRGLFPLLLHPVHLEKCLIPSIIPFSYLFFFLDLAFGILVPQPRILPQSPAVEAWSPHHWTTRKSPTNIFFFFFSNCISLSCSKKALNSGAGALECLGLGDGGRNDPKWGGSFPLGR